MKTTVLFAILANGLLLAAQPVSLSQALRAAVARAKADDARGEVASSQLRLLEANNKWKVELRPSLGLLAFSNPAVLAANLGSSLLMGRRNAPSPVALAGARFDVLAAELAAERLRIRTEIETSRAYFDLLEKQQIARQMQQAVAARKQKAQEMDRLLKASRVTAVDQINYQQDLLDLQQQLVELEMQRRLSSVQLASLLGRLEAAEELEVEDVAVTTASITAAVPSVDRLFTSAMVYRRESQLLNSRIDELRQKAGLRKPIMLESISAGYSFLANSTPGLTNSARSGLLGGNTSQSALNLAIPLRNTGEKAAEKELMAARVHALELEAHVMENELRAQLLSMRGVVQASMERMELASRRVQLSQRRRNMVQVRAENGLGGFAAAASAEESELQAQAALVQATCARKTSLFTLMVICGLQDQPADVQMQVLGN